MKYPEIRLKTGQNFAFNENNSAPGVLQLSFFPFFFFIEEIHCVRTRVVPKIYDRFRILLENKNIKYPRDSIDW